VRRLVHLDPDSRIKQLIENEKRVMEVEHASLKNKGSVFSRLLASCIGARETRMVHREALRSTVVNSMEIHEHLSRRNIDTGAQKMRKAAFRATSFIYWVVILSFLPVFGVALVGFTISWNTLDHFFPGMEDILQVITIGFQVCFAVVALFVWHVDNFLAYTDVIACLVTPFADWYWFLRYSTKQSLSGYEISSYCFLIGYMTIRVWNAAVKPRHRSWRRVALAYSDGISTLDRLDFVWVTRSAAQVVEILPEINSTWDSLVSLWGVENVEAVCRISIYVTDRDQVSNDSLKEEARNTSLYQNGCIRFARPDFYNIIETHSLEMISTRRNSSTLLAFCGSPSLGKSINEQKLKNDMVIAITANTHHTVDFVSESYGGISPKRAVGPEKSPNANLPIMNCSTMETEAEC